MTTTTDQKTITLESSDIKRILTLAINAAETNRSTLAQVYELLIGTCVLDDEFDGPYHVSPSDLGAMTPILLRKIRTVQ